MNAAAVGTMWDPAGISSTHAADVAMFRFESKRQGRDAAVLRVYVRSSGTNTVMELTTRLVRELREA